MRIGIVGKGIVGAALEAYLNSKNIFPLINDQPLGIEDDFTHVNKIFMCLPAHQTPGRGIDLSIIQDRLIKLQGRCPVYLRTTVTPGTADALSLRFNRPVISMPEFLTERTSKTDIFLQGIAVGTLSYPEEKAFIEQIFKDKLIVHRTNLGCELGKLYHNTRMTTRVGFNNAWYFLAKAYGISLEDILFGGEITGHFDPKLNNQVPGPDGMFGWGGKCYGKDLSFAIGLLKKHLIPSSILEAVERENDHFRSIPITLAR